MSERTLIFHAAEIEPNEGSIFNTYLLFNQCDGYHVAYAHFEDGEFQYFKNFLGTTHYGKNFYCAWTKLPDSLDMFAVFGRPAPGSLKGE